MQKCDVRVTNFQKSLANVNERITEDEVKHETLKEKTQSETDRLDSGQDQLRKQIEQVDIKCEEIAIVKNQQKISDERIFLLEDHISNHEGQLQKQMAQMKTLDGANDHLKEDFMTELNKVENSLRDDITTQAEVIGTAQMDAEHRDKAIFNLGNVVAENERRADMHRNPASTVGVWLEELVEMDISFENDVIPEKAPRIEGELASDMARRAQQLARYFADEADHEVIKKTIGFQAQNQEDSAETEEKINALRHEMTEDFSCHTLQ